MRQILKAGFSVRIASEFNNYTECNFQHGIIVVYETSIYH